MTAEKSTEAQTNDSPDTISPPTDDVLLVTDVDGVRTLTLNRPRAYNSLTVELKERLLAALRQAAEDDAVRAVVLTGSGKAFCAGQDTPMLERVIHDVDA